MLASKQGWTAETYLEFERASDQRHEFINGEVYLMAGASATHNLIVANTLASLHAQLRKSPCVIYPSDMRLKVSETGLYSYLDISVVCDAPQFEDEQNDTLLNPVLLVEVLSPSTENYDRGKKSQHYRRIPTLQEYLLIAQDGYHVERYTRQKNDDWLLSETAQPEKVLDLVSIGCKLALADIYEKVTFKGEPS